MEPTTGITAGLTLIAAKDLLGKLLGPTAEYLGDGLKGFVERRASNVGRILEKASRRLGTELERPGAVPPRVLKAVLDEGSFCDDELSASYFAGVVAASRTETGDDRAASLLHLVSRLSSFEIRLHYSFYRTLLSVFRGIPIPPAGGHILFETEDLCAALGIGDGADKAQVLEYCIRGLVRAELIAPSWERAEELELANRFDNAASYSVSDSVVLLPSEFGITLFCWAHGIKDLTQSTFPSLDLSNDVPPVARLPERYKAVIPHPTDLLEMRELMTLQEENQESIEELRELLEKKDGEVEELRQLLEEKEDRIE